MSPPNSAGLPSFFWRRQKCAESDRSAGIAAGIGGSFSFSGDNLLSRSEFPGKVPLLESLLGGDGVLKGLLPESLTGGDGVL